MKSRKKSRRIDSYEKPKTVKQQVKFPYKRVRIDWIDIITEGGWGSDKVSLKYETSNTCK